MELYKWRVTKYKLDAQVAGEELGRIADTRPLTAEAVVEESRDDSAVLHSIFEWNNDKAGDRWRESQAGDLLRNIVVVNIITEEDKSENEYTRAFVNIIDDEDRSYVPVRVVIDNPVYMQQYIGQALRDLEAFRKKYQGVTELSSSFCFLDDFTESVKACDVMSPCNAL